MSVGLYSSFVVTVLLSAVSVKAVESVSAPLTIYFSPEKSMSWKTISASTVPIVWRWVDGATEARLSITSMTGVVVSEIFTPPTSTYTWSVFTNSTIPGKDDIYTLSLQFLEDGKTVVQENASLALLKGTFGPVKVYPCVSSDSFLNVYNEAVIAYDSTWLQNEDELSQPTLLFSRRTAPAKTESVDCLTPCGYYRWKLKNKGWGYGLLDVTLTFPSSSGANITMSGVVRRPETGLFMMVR